MSVKELKLRIADIVISIFSDVPYFKVDNPWKHFIVSKGEADITLNAYYGIRPRMRLERMLFDSRSGWALWCSKGKYILTFTSVQHGSEPYMLATLNSDFRLGDLYFGTVESLQRTSLLADCIRRVYTILMFYQGWGILFHACGISDGQYGTIFLGPSGAGKSTLADLWQRSEATILNEDQVIVRRVRGTFYVYPIPWPEYNQISSPIGVPLERVFFIKHSKVNVVRSKGGIDALRAFLTGAFLPFWDKIRMTYYIELCAELIRKVPCYDLGFAPDDNVVSFVRGIK